MSWSPVVSPVHAEVGDDDDDEEDNFDFINGPSPTFSPSGSDNEDQNDNPFCNSFKPSFDYRKYQSIFEDKILNTEQLVKLANLSRLRIVEKGSKEWILTADVVVKFQNCHLFTVILTLCTSEIAPENVQLSVCIKEEKNISNVCGKFRSCTASLKFLGKHDFMCVHKNIICRLVDVPSNQFTVELALSLFSSGSRFVIPDLEFKGIQCIQQNKEKLRTPEGKSAIRDFMKNQYELSPALLIGLYS